MRSRRPWARWVPALGATLLVAALAACSSGTDDAASPSASPSGSSVAPSSVPTATPIDPRVSGTVATDLEAPWGLAFLPDGSALVSQRDKGDIVHVIDNGTVLPVGSVPGVAASGEGGLMGLALSPTFPKDREVYAYLTTATD